MTNSFRLSRKSIEKDAARLRVLLDPVASGASVSIAGAGADNRVTLWQGAASLTSSAELYFDDTNNRLGVNRGSPASAIDVEANAGGDIVLQMRAIAGQTGNLLQATSSAGGALTIIDADGNVESGAVPFSHLAAGYQLGITGRAEFSDIMARGEFRASTFAYDEVHANSGDLMIASASVVETDCVVSAATPSTDDLAVALFSADTTTPNTGDTVTFTSACLGGAVLTYSWDVDGDGDADYATQNCSHVYNTAGVYSVTLTVTSAAGVNYHTRTNYITVTETAVPASRVTDALVHLYEFADGEGSLVRDTGGNNYHLTINDLGAVTWGSGYLTVNSAASITSAAADTALINAVKASNEFTVDAWVKPATASQSAARIVSLAADYSNANFALIHDSTNYVARLRSATTSDAGLPSTDAPAVAAATLQHVAFTCDAAGALKVYLGSVLQTTGALTAASDMSGWNAAYCLSVANEIIEGRPWLGELHTIGLYSKALSAAEVLQNFNAGGGVVDPAAVIPVADFTVDDQTINVGDTATFTDASTDPTTWYWNFGDGGTSALQNPTHVYATAGTFAVYLTVTSSTGNTHTKTELDFMTVGTPPTGTTYIVATDGNDDSDGLTTATAWRTINTSVTKLAAGDRLLVRGGTYHERVTISVSGASGLPITIMAYPAETPIIDGEYTYPFGDLAILKTLPDGTVIRTDPVTGLGFTFAGLVWVKGNYITLDGLEIKRSRGSAIWAESYDNLTVQNCTIHDNRSNAIELRYCDDVTVDTCTVYHCMDYSPSGSHLTWRPAVCYIRSDNGLVKNCSVYNNWTEGIVFNGCTGGTVQDCTSWQNTNTHIYVNHGVNTTVQRNFCWSGTTVAACGIGIATENSFGLFGVPTYPCGDVTVKNNIVVGCYQNFRTLSPANPPISIPPMYDLYIYHNTFVYPVGSSDQCNVWITNNTTYTGEFFIKNNICLATIGADQVRGNSAWATWSNNCWFATVTNAGAKDITTDVYTDPRLQNPGVSRVYGTITAGNFFLLGSGDCLGAGANLGVADDYSGDARGATPDIGADEV